MSAPIFPTPIDNASGLANLAAPYVSGSGSLALDDATPLGSPSPSAPVRLTVYADSTFGAILGQFLVTGRSGNTLAVAVDAGYQDVAIPLTSPPPVVAVGVMANTLKEIYAALQAALAGAAQCQAALAALATVAKSGAYSDLSGRPSFAAVAMTGAYGDLSGRPILSTVATSGLYADLLSKPTFAAVATSGSYIDLINRPALATVATSGAYADLSGKPTFATVATTGSYTDLANLPTLGTLASQNGTFSGTSSGNNTGDQTNITGQAGTVATIAGLISAGTNVTITGSGTSAAPYVVNVTASGGSATPGGSNGQLQYNSSGAFAGSQMTTDGKKLYGGSYNNAKNSSLDLNSNGNGGISFGLATTGSRFIVESQPDAAYFQIAGLGQDLWLESYAGGAVGLSTRASGQPCKIRPGGNVTVQFPTAGGIQIFDLSGSLLGTLSGNSSGSLIWLNNKSGVQTTVAP